jgi:hypothetical protein
MVSAAEILFSQAAVSALVEHVGEEAVQDKHVINASVAVTLDGKNTLQHNDC